MDGIEVRKSGGFERITKARAGDDDNEARRRRCRKEGDSNGQRRVKD